MTKYYLVYTECNIPVLVECASNWDERRVYMPWDKLPNGREAAAEIIRQMLEETGLSISRVSRLADASSLAHYLNGKRQTMTLATYGRIIDVLVSQITGVSHQNLHCKSLKGQDL